LAGRLLVGRHLRGVASGYREGEDRDDEKGSDPAYGMSSRGAHRSRELRCERMICERPLTRISFLRPSTCGPAMSMLGQFVFLLRHVPSATRFVTTGTGRGRRSLRPVLPPLVFFGSTLSRFGVAGIRSGTLHRYYRFQRTLGDFSTPLRSAVEMTSPLRNRLILHYGGASSCSWA
jgi:hypothetical protein